MCFVVDTSNYDSWVDIKSDQIPNISKNKTKNIYYKFIDNNFQLTHDELGYDFIITRMIYGNEQSKDFHKVLMYASNKAGIHYPYVFIQYYFDGEEYDIIAPQKRDLVSYHQ